MVCGVEHVTHIVEENKSKVIAYVGQRHWRSANLQVVDEQPLTANGKSGYQVARSSLVDGEAAQRIAAAREEQFGQRDGSGLRRQLPRGWQTEEVVDAIGMQDPNLRVPREDPPLLNPVVGGILHQHL